MDVFTKRVMKNAYRITSKYGKTCIRIRVPGGHISADLLSNIQQIAKEYGNGTVHLTSRQGFEVPGIDFNHMSDVNKLLQPIIEGLNINQEEFNNGYPAAGARNVSACIGNRVCQVANFDTTRLAQRIEDVIYPNDFHVKVAITGCPNDCAKVRMQDFGIIAMTLPQYDKERCVACNACVKACKGKATNVLEMVNWKIERNHKACIGCGECIRACPTRAFTRSKDDYFRFSIMGRTGKKNPRLGEDFLKWADEDSIVKIIENDFKFIDKYINRNLPKEHIGYIVDRAGFKEWRNIVMDGVELNPLAEEKVNVYWSGINYRSY